MGVTVWGPAPVCDEIRRKLALELGTEVRQPRTLIRVYGYGPSFGLNACDENSYAQRELRRVWPTQDIKMIDSQLLLRLGLHGPTLSLTLEGGPAGLGASDPQGRRCQATTQGVGEMRHQASASTWARAPA